jgi:hypothetical protein
LPNLARTGTAAILAGALIFAGQAGELVFGSPSDLVDAVFVTLAGAGIGGLAVALWGLRDLVATRGPGRIGVRVALMGAALLGLFAVQAVIELIRTGDVPENFILFGVGFLLLVVGHLLFARHLRPALGRAWLLPLAAAAGAVLALVVEADPLHDIGLFAFEGAWVALGVALLHAERRGGVSRAPAHQTVDRA